MPAALSSRAVLRHFILIPGPVREWLAPHQMTPSPKTLVLGTDEATHYGPTRTFTNFHLPLPAKINHGCNGSGGMH